MTKMHIFFQLFTKSLKNPKLIKEIIQERSQIQDDEKHKTHEYKFDFTTIEDFFHEIFSTKNLHESKNELLIIESHANNFFTKIESENYPSKKKPYPINYSINYDSRNFLYFLCRLLKPENIVETGVAYGLSSLYILNALEKNNFGKLHSIDSVFRPWQSKEMIGSIIPDNLRHRWNFVLGKSNDKLEGLLNQIGEIDIFIHDSLHTYENMMYEFDTVYDYVKKDGIIVSDDVLGNDAFFDFTSKRNLKNFLIKVDENVGLGIIIK